MAKPLDGLALQAYFRWLGFERVTQELLIHIRIDRYSQGRGYGKEALRLFLQFIQDHYPQCQALQLTVHAENEHAQRLYSGVGFQPTGATLSDEPVYRLSFKPS